MSLLPPTTPVFLPVGNPSGIQISLGRAEEMATAIGSALAAGSYSTAWTHIHELSPYYNVRSPIARDLLTGYAIGHPFSQSRFHAAVACIMRDREREEYEAYRGIANQPSVIDALIEALRDTLPHVRALAANALGRLDAPQAVNPLIQALGDEDERVREEARKALGDIDDPSAVEPLVHAFQDNRKDVRIAVVSIIWRFRDPRCLELLIRALKDEDKDVRKTAVWVIKEVGGPRAEAALIQAFQDESEEVRLTVLNGLWKFRSLPLLEILALALQDESPVVRRNTAWALESIIRIRKHFGQEGGGT